MTFNVSTCFQLHDKTYIPKQKYVHNKPSLPEQTGYSFNIRLKHLFSTTTCTHCRVFSAHVNRRAYYTDTKTFELQYQCQLALRRMCFYAYSKIGLRSHSLHNFMKFQIMEKVM